MLSVVITSYSRPDLLKRTLLSFNTFNDYPIEDFIIIEDSGRKDMNDFLTRHYSDYHLILHDQNKGAYESIDEAYSHIKTKYVVHIEDDWMFYKRGFVEQALAVLESNPMIMQVNLSNEQNMPVEPEIFRAGDVEYRLEGTDVNGWWHGFTCRPSVRSMIAYDQTKPWTQWAIGENLSIKECMVGKRYYELGYRAAVLNEYYCLHTGLNRCTWHN